MSTALVCDQCQAVIGDPMVNRRYRLTWLYENGFSPRPGEQEWDFCSLSCLKRHVGGRTLQVGGTTGTGTH